MSKLATQAAMPDASIDMRTRIQLSSVRLFNLHGYHNVSMLRIAQTVGIAPGSVLYYYKKKRDLLMSLLPLAEASIKTAYSPENVMAPTYSVKAYIKLFHAFWDFRFIYSDIWNSLGQDIELRDRYLAMEHSALEFLQTVHQRRLANGDILPMASPVTTKMLTQNHWAIWLDWLRCTVLLHPHQESLSDSVIREGIVRAFSLWRPYVTDQYAQQFMQRLMTVLPSEIGPD